MASNAGTWHPDNEEEILRTKIKHLEKQYKDMEQENKLLWAENKSLRKLVAHYQNARRRPLLDHLKRRQGYGNR